MDNAPDSRAAAAACSAASLEASLNPLPHAPGPHAEQALAVPDAADGAASPSALDAHGFDPADYRWVPVRRKPRKDGWTPQRQVDFIAALAHTGCVEQAALEVGMSARSCFRLRAAPGAESFAQAWDTALQHAAHRLLDLAFDRAVRGTDEPVFDRDGHVVGRRFRQNDRLLMFLLRAYMPERFRHAHRDWRAPDEALPPAAAPIDEALRLLQPVPPAEPHTLMAPEELEDALLVADIMPPGELPRWHRGRDDSEPPPAPDPAFEAELETLKHGESDPAEGPRRAATGKRRKRALD
jgi:hypothetical protein